jgi:hypothetical protein
MPRVLCLAGALVAAMSVARADDTETWNAHVQSTYIWQRKPAFSSPYEGPHSLVGGREKSYSLTATAAFGARIGATEFYLDPELAEGVPLSGLQGLAAFTNGEMARTSGADPSVYIARLFVRQVIGLGSGDEAGRETVESSANQLASRYDKRRLVLSAGTLSVLDLFDANTLAHDPRMQFMNWALMTHAAFDYPADSRGYTRGAAVEYLDHGWAIRAGRFAQPREPNGLALDDRLLRHWGDVLEASVDYGRAGRSGTVRLLGFRNRATMASYDDALALAAREDTEPQLAPVRSGDKTKSGIGASVEHHFGEGAGLFARAMWADGKTETYAFTEADRSVSAGAVLGGAAWGRPQDSIAVAAAESALSPSHRQILRDGGQTFFLGDGRLDYRMEGMLEAWYSLALAPGVWLSVDVQRIANPGYNADRGPASFIAARLHLEK